MKIFHSFFLLLFLFLFPVLSHGIVGEMALAAMCKKVFATSLITESISFIFDFAKTATEKWTKFKNDAISEKGEVNVAGVVSNMNVTVEQKTKVSISTETSTDDEFDVKAELFQLSEIIKQTNEKMKASFKSVKTLMRDQHFQTHIQFPVESMVLHLEQFLSSLSNSTENDLKITCTKTLPNSILKKLELMIKDNFLIHQSDLNPEIFAKLEKGIILMIKQLIFAQSVCLQIRNFDSKKDVQKVFGFHMAKNIEFYIKKQRMEVQTKFHLNTVFSFALNNENGFSKVDFKNNNASLYENIGTKLCQKTKSSLNTSNADFFLTRDTSDFTIISKNRYFKETYNGWKIYAFYPKFTLKGANRIEAAKVDEDYFEGDEERKTKNVLKNQIIFECKNQGHCSLIGNDLSGMFENEKGKIVHYSICGNIGVTLGRPIIELRKAEELSAEEKAEVEKWEKTKAELTEYLRVQKIKDLKAEENKKKENEELIEATISKYLKEINVKNDEIQKTDAVAFVSKNNGSFNGKNLYATFIIAFCCFIFL